jgi:hypothetical protein
MTAKIFAKLVETMIQECVRSNQLRKFWPIDRRGGNKKVRRRVLTPKSLSSMFMETLFSAVRPVEITL